MSDQRTDREVLEAILAGVQAISRRLDRLEQAAGRGSSSASKTAEARATVGRQAQEAARSRAAASWVTENLPDLVVNGEPCAFAVEAALRLVDQGGMTPEKVRAARELRLARLDGPAPDGDPVRPARLDGDDLGTG